jgi:hypothetical protein
MLEVGKEKKRCSAGRKEVLVTASINFAVLPLVAFDFHWDCDTLCPTWCVRFSRVWRGAFFQLRRRTFENRYLTRATVKSAFNAAGRGVGSVERRTARSTQDRGEVMYHGKVNGTSTVNSTGHVGKKGR